MSELPLRYPDQITSSPRCARAEIEAEVELEEQRTRYSRGGYSGSTGSEQRVYFNTQPSCWAHNFECPDPWDCVNAWIHRCTQLSGENSLELCDVHYRQIVTG